MKNKIFISLGFLVILSVLFFNIIPVRASSVAVSGYAWSETIGWIEMAPAFGGVSFDDVSGTLTGYAWSENIGWVKFGGLSSFPGGVGSNASVNTSTGSATGWIRACAGTATGNCSTMTSRTDGWDGWIRLDSNLTNPVVLNLGTGDFSGFAWGSDVVGWVDFTGVSTGSLTRILTIDSTNPASGVNMTVLPADKSGNTDGSTQLIRIYNNNTDVTVTAPANAGGNTFTSWTGCDSVTGTYTCNIKMDSNETVTVNYGTPASATVSISATPIDINKGDSSNITFSYQNATNCTITSYGLPLSYPDDSDTFPVSPVVSTTYEIVCSPAGTNSHANVVVNILDQEFDIKVVKSGQGVVVSNPVGINCGEGCSSQSAKFEEDTEITLTATPSTGRIFIGWNDPAICDVGFTKEIDGSGGTCTLTATGDKTIYANFAVDPNFKEF